MVNAGWRGGGGQREQLIRGEKAVCGAVHEWAG